MGLKLLASSLLVLSVGVLSAADAPPASLNKLTDAELVALLKLEKQQALLASSMQQLQIMFQDQKGQMTAVEASIEKMKAGLKAAHSCVTCDIDEDGNLTPKKEAKDK